MVDDGLPVFTAEVVKWDVNLTAPADVLTCNLFQLGQLGLEQLVGRDARIHPGASLRNVVVGERAVIEHPIAIADSVVFPDTVVKSTHGFERFIVTPETQIDCRHLGQARGD
jgi:ADP-glucose pyrophosphorylase